MNKELGVVIEDLKMISDSLSGGELIRSRLLRRSINTLTKLSKTKKKDTVVTEEPITFHTT
jgi:hypothetical protein